MQDGGGDAGSTPAQPFGQPGEPLAPHSPFRYGLIGALGVLVAILIARILLAATPVLLLVAIAMFLAIGLDPAVTWLQGRGLKRGLAVLVTAIVIVGCLTAFFAAFITPLVSQVAELGSDLPGYAERLREDNSLFRDLDDRFGLRERLETIGSEVPADGEAVGQALSVAQRVVGAIFGAVTVMVLALYFLAALPRIRRTAYRLVPRSRRARVTLLGDEVLTRIGAYVLGNLATSAAAGIVSFVFLQIAGVPYPFALALFVAVMDLIPLVGAAIGAAVCVVVAFFVGVPTGVAALIFFLLYQQFENFVLVPRVMKRAVDVSPVATIVAALVGASLLGVFGALLAVPVAAAIQIIGRQVLLPRQEAA